MIVRRLKEGVRRWTPKPVFNALEYQRQRMRVASVAGEAVDFSALGAYPEEVHRRLFAPGPADAEWREVEATLRRAGIWNAALSTGGIDLKALYYLARRRGVRSVLEIGTHVGGSAVAFAHALGRNAPETSAPPRLVTVDIRDVNDLSTGPWREAGMPRPPREVVGEMNVEVEFVTAPSVQFLQGDTRAFDLVFLDGDHRGDTTYREIVLAAARLAPGGLIALHDYSPRIIFATLDDGRAIPGPYVASQRILSEHPELSLRIFDRVPWADGSRVSYVAVLCRGDE